MGKAKLSDAEFETAIEASLADHAASRAADRVFDRELRRVIQRGNSGFSAASCYPRDYPAAAASKTPAFPGISL